jgi:hypothetical protein
MLQGSQSNSNNTRLLDAAGVTKQFNQHCILLDAAGATKQFNQHKTLRCCRDHKAVQPALNSQMLQGPQSHSTSTRLSDAAGIRSNSTDSQLMQRSKQFNQHQAISCCRSSKQTNSRCAGPKAIYSAPTLSCMSYASHSNSTNNQLPYSFV